MKRFVPHAYQSWAITQVVTHSAYGLLLPMGAGKTVVMLTALDELLHDRLACTCVLIIAPLRVARTTWTDEAAKWAHLQHLRISQILGEPLKRIFAIKRDADIYIINRENVPWLVEACGAEWPFDCVVIDELSSFKSWSSSRFKALRSVRGKISRIYGLTGTPAANGLLDLWSQIWLLDRGARLGSGITKYKQRWFVPSQWDRKNPAVVYKWEPVAGAAEEIYSAISDITASVEAGQVKLPGRIEVEHWVDIPMTAYNEMLNTNVVDGEILAVNAAVAIGKLQQICNGAIYDETGEARFIHNVKLDKLEDLVEGALGKPVLVYYQYRFDLERILERFPNARELRSPESISMWMQGYIPVGVAHPASCGHGLNLQSGGHIIVWYGVPWSLELYQQANARLDRQGQEETVIVHHILANKTVDEDVLARLRGKDESQQELLQRLLRTP